MTREEALKILKEPDRVGYNVIHANDEETTMYNIKSRMALEMAIEALEQEPCEDAISRQAAINIASGFCHPSRVADELAKLPSVNPQEPTGHWIGIDEEPHEVWECDHCGFVIDGSGCIDPDDYRDTYKFCPNCGAKMQEVEE